MAMECVSQATGGGIETLEGGALPGKRHSLPLFLCSTSLSVSCLLSSCRVVLTSIPFPSILYIGQGASSSGGDVRLSYLTKTSQETAIGGLLYVLVEQ